MTDGSWLNEIRKIVLAGVKMPIDHDFGGQHTELKLFNLNPVREGLGDPALIGLRPSPPSRLAAVFLIANSRARALLG